MNQKEIGAKIRELRSKMGLTTVTLARKVKLSEAQVSRLENGLHGFRSATLIKFAKAFSVSPDYFFAKGKGKKTSASKVAEELEGYGLIPRRNPRKAPAKLHLLDVVALTADLPHRGLVCGQVGTVVETLAPGVFEVEFSDDAGKTYATAALRAEQLIVLHYHPAKAG